MEKSEGQYLNPALPEERDYPNSSSQVETLTELQREVVDSIGNRQLSSRLYKRTLRIYKREERLEAIEFYRTHVHVNPQTGEEHNISIATASEALYISECTLKRWIDEEKKITSMREGTSRDDGKRYESVSTSERLKSGGYPFLRLTPQQLSSRNWIKGKDLYKLHPMTHPVPFIGIEGGRRGNIKSFADAYQFLGLAGDTSHPGHPRKPDLDTEEQPPYPILESAGFCLENSTEPTPRDNSRTVQTVNALLYRLAPNYSLRQLGREQCAPCYEQLGACVGVVCEHLVAASDKLESAIPIRIEFDYDEPFKGAPTHWAINLLLRTGAQILVPLSLCLRGSIKHEVIPDTLLLQGWTVDYEMLKCKTRKRQRFEVRENAIRYSQEFYRKSQTIFQKFRLSPVLFIEDVEMLFLGSQFWRPRRFSPLWTLYRTILHSTYRSGDTLTPIYGKYTEIRSLVDSIVTKAPLVSFSTTAKAFQLVSLSNISLIPQVQEQAIFSQYYQHLEASADSHKALSLDFIEGTLKQDPHTIREREFREKLMHALKLSVQNNLEHINNEKRCIYYTCPEPQEAPSSYYCHHHSRSLIAYVTNSPQPIDWSMCEEQKLEVKFTEQTRGVLKRLKELYGRPEKTWILDFEYVSMPKKFSPIPLQLAIRQLDGKLLYQGNIDYGMSMAEFMRTISSYVSDKHRMMGTLFLRCYGELSTNGQSSHRIRDQIMEVCGYDPNDTEILSWYAAQDMQCFLMILTGNNELVQDKISHKGHGNFQTINIGTLCRKLFPGLPSTTLQSVHGFLGGGEGYQGKYHTASYDTEAMARIIKALVQLI